MKTGVCTARTSTVRSAGFTIIETMVVLAVTGILFVVIAVTLAGRQNEAEFVHAIQSVQSQLQQTIDQVSDGFFPTNNLNCSAGASLLKFDVGGSQGANDQCVFLGSVVQFGVQGSSDPEQYRIYTIAGLRGPSIAKASPFINVTPTVVGLSSSGDYTSYSTPRALEYGLTVKSVQVNGGGTYGAIGFLMEPGGFATSGGFNAGAQPVDVVPIVGSNINQPIATAVGLINGSTGLNDPNLTADAPLNPDSGVQICFVSGGTNQSGLITIGGSGRQLIVKLDIKSNKSCS